MADKLTQLVLAALGRAAAEPTGLPLHGSKLAPGLFAATPLGKQAAQRCLIEGYLRAAGTEEAKAAELFALSDKGLAYLLGEVSPRIVLEDLVRALEARQTQAAGLLAAARQMQTTLEGIKASAEKVLGQVPVGDGVAAAVADTWKASVLAFLSRWQASGALEDCPLPELFRQARQAAPALTIGGFHDALRQFHDAGHIGLHPWTGPLYAIPEPPYALLVGHEIAYYASPRRLAG